MTHFKNLRDDSPPSTKAKYLPLLHAPTSLYPDMDEALHGESWYKLSGESPGLYPLKKDARPLTKQEIVEFKDEVREAELKELASWVKQRAGQPKLRSEYKSRTGLDPIPSRWVEVFKIKQGRRIIRIRLVLKGFAEKNQQTLQTTSPTSTRIGHRLIYSKAAQEGWDIWSIDVSSAFVRGFTFDELPEEGHHHRQPVAFLPPDPEFFTLMAELDPDT